MYTGQMDLCSVEKALLCLNCADWLQMEELVEVISEFVERKLDGWNCFSILVATERPSLTKLRDMAMETIMEYFYDEWVYSGFIELPFDVVLEVLRCDEVVVKSELDIFLAALRWIVWSDNSEMSVIENKACELISEHTSLYLYDVDVAEAEDAYGEVNYTELSDGNFRYHLIAIKCMCRTHHLCVIRRRIVTANRCHKHGNGCGACVYPHLGVHPPH